MSQECPHCSSSSTSELKQKTILGYRCFRCGSCERKFNERTGTPFNFLEFPTDVVLLVVRWRLRYKLSLPDLGEMFLERGLSFTHEAVRAWETRFAPMISDALRRHRRGSLGVSWVVDETYVKVGGRWCTLYRAIDRAGNLVDCRLSETRDMAAAKGFFRGALKVAREAPERVTTDGHDSYPRAIREELGETVPHRTNRYLNHWLEQDHRGIEQRYGPMRGFGSFESAQRFCRAFDEMRSFYRIPGARGTRVSLDARRRHHRQRTATLHQILLAA
jgi:putative transposase